MCIDSKSCGRTVACDVCTMRFHSTQTRTSCLLHALYMTMVLSCGVLLEPIYIHPLDETTSFVHVL